MYELYGYQGCDYVKEGALKDHSISAKRNPELAFAIKLITIVSGDISVIFL